MAQVLMSPPPAGRKWLLALGAAALAAAAAAWWTHATPPEPSPSTGTARDESTPVTPQASPGSELAFKEMVSGQSEAAKALASQPAVRPVDGPITERPSYVSPMEWMVLKGTASQKPQPERELTRMVNFLRFTKQMELLQSLPRTADAQPRREALANALLADLPERLINDEMSLKDLRQTQAELLQDAESDPQRRQARAQAESRRLEEALASMQAGGHAH